MYTIKINGSYLPNGVKIKSSSLNLNQGQSGERAVLSFEIIDMNLNGSPFIWNTLCGQKVELYEDGTLIFGGQLDEPETRKINNHPVFGEKIQCVDWNYLMDRAYINQSYARQLISDTFKDMIDSFLASDGVWYDSNSIKETSGQYVSINCPYVQASQAFDEMASLINWQWKIGPDKKIYLNEYTSSVGTPIIEHVSNYIPNSLITWDDRSEYRNKQVLKDVNALTDGTIPEKASPTPDQDKSWTVRFPLNQKPELYLTENISDPPSDDLVDPSQVGIGGLDSGLTFYWNKNSNIIQQDADADSIEEGKFLVLKYVGQYQIDIIEQDNTAIAERQSVEGGSGLYINVESGNNIEDVTIAESKANAMLDRYARIATKISFSSYTINLEVGQIIDITIPSLNIDTTKNSNDYFLVMEKRIKDVGTLLNKSYVLVDGSPVGGWIKFFANLISPGKDWTIRPDAKVDIPVNSEEAYSWDGATTMVTYDCLYPEDDPGGLYPSNALYPGTTTSTTVLND